MTNMLLTDNLNMASIFMNLFILVDDSYILHVKVCI